MNLTNHVTPFEVDNIQYPPLEVNYPPLSQSEVMQCRVSRVQSEDSGKHPCGVCRKGVGDNSIRCVVS